MLGLLVVAFVLNAGRAASQAASVRAQGGLGDQFFATYLARFDAVRDALPARGVIGYIGPVRQHEATGARGGTYAFVLAQYAVAPLRLDRRYQRYDLVLGNYHGRDPAQDHRTYGYEVVERFGDGVVLLRRKQP